VVEEEVAATDHLTEVNRLDVEKNLPIEVVNLSAKAINLLTEAVNLMAKVTNRLIKVEKEAIKNLVEVQIKEEVNNTKYLIIC